MKRLTLGLSAAALLPPLAAFACPAEQASSWWEVVETYQLMLPRAASFWSPIAWSLGVLALAVVSVRERKSPGFARVFFTPGFMVAAGLSTIGAFFLRWLPVGGHLG